MNKCRIFIILVWAAVFAGISAAAFGPEDPNIPSRTNELRRQILQEQIQPVYLSLTSVSTVDLDLLIAGLERLTVPVRSPRENSPEKASGTEASSPSASEAAEQPASDAEKTELTDEKPLPEAVRAAEAPRGLERLDAVAQPIDAMGAADALFRCGDFERAERFYRLAAERAGSPSEPDWQWAVFQRANCLRHSQPEAARRLYQELLQKAPGSRWNGAARASLELLDLADSLQASTLKGLVREADR
ncbi:MAG: hypothetical protein WHS88_05830 [Anaerohalosphaeraceae bacterium]